MGSMHGRRLVGKACVARLLALLAALACACALALGALGAAAPTAARAATAPTSFKDVASGVWYTDWIGYAAKNGLMTGMKDAKNNYTGYFEPEGELTRAQVATVLWRLSGSPSAASAGFADVAGGAWYASAVNYCASVGVVTGYPSGPDAGRFLPDKKITREELATMVWRYAKYRGVDVSNPDPAAYKRTKDYASVDSYAVDALTWTSAVGVMSGVDYGSKGFYLEPFGTATRGQAAKVFSVLHRDILTGKVTTPHPGQHTAQLYVLGSSDDVPVYSGYTTIVFAKTSDTLSWVGFDVLDASGKQESVTTISTSYADVATTSNSVTNGWRKVEGGYLCYLSFDSAGTKTFRLKEDGNVLATLKINVTDGTKAEDAWMDAVLASVTTSAMDPFQKMQAVQDYLLKNFRYSVVMGGTYVTLAQYGVPYWVSYRWNSYTSPAALCRFAEKIGGFSDIHNCYGDYAVGTTNWQMYHHYCKVVRNGETRYYSACPDSSTGEISSYSKIDFTNLNSVLHFNSDALKGLNKAAALSDGFEVLSADDGAEYDEVAFDAVVDGAGSDGAASDAAQAVQDGDATFDELQPAGAEEKAAEDATTAGGDSASVEDPADDSASADADAAAGDGWASPDAGAEPSDPGDDSAEADETGADVPSVSPDVAYEQVASPDAADEAVQEPQLLAA